MDGGLLLGTEEHSHKLNGHSWSIQARRAGIMPPPHVRRMRSSEDKDGEGGKASRRRRKRGQAVMKLSYLTSTQASEIDR